MRPLRENEDFPDPKAANPEVAQMDGRALFEKLRLVDPEACTALYLSMMGMKVPEIADAMDLPARQVRRLLSSGRAVLLVSK